MHTVKYQSAVLLDKNGQRPGVLYTRDDVILYAGQEDPMLAYDQLIDVGGHVLTPAFVDMHCHLRDPGYPQKETMETGMRAALSGGYATLCAMANTLPVCTTPELVQANHKKAEELGLCRLYQGAAAGEDLLDSAPTDWAALSKGTPVITNDGKTIVDDGFMQKLMEASSEYGFIISTHCQPENPIVARDLALLKMVGGNLHIGHISTAQTAEMVRKALAEGLKVTCEITPHHLIGFDLDYKVNPPIRTKADTEALIEAIKDGTAYCLATDHAPHTPEDKAAGMAGISNIDYAMGAYLWVFEQSDIPLTRFSEMASYNPAKLLGLKAGLLEEGYLADLTIVDLSYRGVVEPDTMLSHSHNTPFAGYPLRGKVLKTIVGGKTVYDHGSFVC